jgi:exodeoxyribonuclease V beta subunit
MDLQAHALIEASAGTGKTYTIEEIFCRLLLGGETAPGIEPTDILVLTFTEKATAELKQRIMQKLLKELPDLKSDGIRAKRVKNAIDVFGEVPIQTIHGFCFSVLSDFGFESGQPLEMETIGDRPVLEMVFGKILRGAFLKRYQTVMKDVLTVLGFARKSSDYGPGFRDNIISLVNRIDFKNDIIHGFNTDPAEPLPVLVIKEASDIFTPDFFTAAAIVKENLSGSNKKHRFFIENLLSYQKKLNSLLLSELFSELKNLKTKAAAKGKQKTTQNTGGGEVKKENLSGAAGFDRLIANCGDKISPETGTVFSAALYELENYMESLKTDALNFIFRELHRGLFDFKRDRGYLSYDDMLNLVRDAVCNTDGGLLRQALFQRYRAVLIDEFQDTDQVQWDIFRTVFLGADNCRHPVRPLFLIGDPKQAIYSFRRADIYTYFAAAGKMKELEAQRVAKLYSLPDNYRSTPALLDIFNAIFSDNSSKPWFSKLLKYENVAYPQIPSEKQKKAAAFFVGLPSVHSLSALTVFKIGAERKSAAAKMLYARFIGSEIRRLLALTSTCGGKELFSPGDFCILIRGRNYAVYVEQALREYAIPYSYYKKPELFASEEASQLEALLMAVAAPGNPFLRRRALLTHFFNFPLDVVQADDSAPVRAVRELFRHWHKTLEAGKTGEFFRSLMEDSNFLHNPQIMDVQQLQATHQRIVETLLENCQSRRPTAMELAEKLRFLRRHGAAKDDSFTHPVAEGSKERVQLMTMHVSKGLQFPVVFVFGNFSRSSKGPDYYRFHREDDGRQRVVWDFEKSDHEHEKAHFFEEEAENQRLYYVALTRAEKLLYVAHYQLSLRHLRCFGSFLSEKLDECCGPDSGLDVCWVDGEAMAQDLRAGASEVLSPYEPVKNALAQASSPTEVSPDSGDKTGRCLADSILKLKSFSGLSRLQKELPTQGFSLNPLSPSSQPADDEQTEMETALIPGLLPVGESDISVLPGGTETGNLIHELFEKLDWVLLCNMGEEHLADMVQAESIFRNYGIVEPQQRQTALLMVKKTLTTPLLQLQNRCLLEIPEAERFHELDFIFDPTFGGQAEKSPYFDLLRGAVDIVFRYQGLYYIGDWKTNSLHDYTQAGLDEAMSGGNYLLQADIYRQAVCAWLSSKGLDADRVYGGTFYFFVRGIDNSGLGIWFR